MPRDVFVRLEEAFEVAPLREAEIKLLELKAARLEQALVLMTRTATLAQADRDRAWIQVSQTLQALHECSKTQGDPWWLRGALVVGGAGAAAIGCAVK